MHKSLFTILFVIASLASVSASAQSVQNLNGIWRTEDGSSTVRVAKCPSTTNWCAIVIAERLTPGEQSVLNQMTVREMRPKGNNNWAGQYVIDGQNMKASAKLSGPDTLSFKVCAQAFLCETIRLNRVRG